MLVGRLARKVIVDSGQDIDSRREQPMCHAACTAKEVNGAKHGMVNSRGNGLAFGMLLRVLEYLPYPVSRRTRFPTFYESYLKMMPSG